MFPRELPSVDIVVRCRNKMPYVERTIERLLQQGRCVPRVTVLDCASTDGSRECAERLGVRIVPISDAVASPGAMMNQAMRVTRSLIVAFVDADATPLTDTSVATLIEAFDASPTIAAVFGRQTARRALGRPSTGGGPPSSSRRPPTGGAPAASGVGGSFSMAAAAIHRSAWHCHAFDERVRAAEDVEWTRRLRRDGWTTEFVAAAPFEECHDATLRGHFLRTSVRTFAKSRALGASTP